MRIAPPLSGNLLGTASNDFIVAEWTDPGGQADPPLFLAPLHRHHDDDEGWYVLDGVLRVQNGDEVVELHSGSGIIVNKGTPHTFWNPTTSPVRYLLLMTPRIHALIEALHTLDNRTPQTLQALFEAYRSELL